MRGRSAPEDPVASPELKETFILEDLGGTVNNTLVRELTTDRIRLHVHDSDLEKLERKGSERTDETRDGGGNQSDSKVVAVLLTKELSGRIVGNHHTSVHGNTTKDNGDGTTEKSHETLLLDNAREGGEDVGVTTTLGDGQGGIGLHTDEGEIAGVTEDGSDGTGDHTSGGLGTEGNVLSTVSLLEILTEHIVETETGSTVDDLSGDSGGGTLVETLPTALGLDLLGNGGETRGLAVDGLGDLDLGLDEIKREDLGDEGAR